MGRLVTNRWAELTKRLWQIARGEKYLLEFVDWTKAWQRILVRMFIVLLWSGAITFAVSFKLAEPSFANVGYLGGCSFFGGVVLQWYGFRKLERDGFLSRHEDLRTVRPGLLDDQAFDAGGPGDPFGPMPSTKWRKAMAILAVGGWVPFALVWVFPPGHLAHAIAVWASAPVIVVLYRAVRIRLRLDDGEPVAYNQFRTRRLPLTGSWSLVAEPLRFPRHVGPKITVLRDTTGHRLPLDAVTWAPIAWKQRWLDDALGRGVRVDDRSNGQLETLLTAGPFP